MSKARAPTERWLVARHIDRVLQTLVAPALSPDLPDEQFNAALEHGIRGVAVLAIARDASIEDEIAAFLNKGEWMEAFHVAYDALARCGVLRPAELGEDDIGSLVD